MKRFLSFLLIFAVLLSFVPTIKAADTAMDDLTDYSGSVTTSHFIVGYTGTTPYRYTIASILGLISGINMTPLGVWDWTSATVTWPTFNQNTSGTAANVSGTPALPNGTTATTQSAGDNSTKLATTAYGDALVSDVAYNESTWNGVGGIAPSKNVIRDYLESLFPSGSDGYYRLVLPNNTARTPAAAMELYPEGSVWKINENGTEYSAVKGPTAGPVLFSGPTAARTITVDDADQTVAARNRDNTFTGANTIGDGGDDQRILMRVNTGDGTWSGITMNLTCHETLAFGNTVFINSDGEAALADADGVATMPVIGITVVGGNAADTCTILTHGVITEADWNFTAGQRLYASETGGGVENTLSNIGDTNDVVQIIGVALSGDTIMFNPSLVEVVLE